MNLRPTLGFAALNWSLKCQNLFQSMNIELTNGINVLFWRKHDTRLTSAMAPFNMVYAADDVVIQYDQSKSHDVQYRQLFTT